MGDQDTDNELFGDPKLRKLTMGDWGAAGEMAGERRKGDELDREAMAMSQRLKDKTQSLRQMRNQTR